jgi:hypothetical protein
VAGRDDNDFDCAEEEEEEEEEAIERLGKKRLQVLVLELHRGKQLE